MKIDKVRYSEGFAWFVVDGNTKKTYGIQMEEKTKIKEITDELKAKVQKEDKGEIIYNNLNVNDLEGTDI